MTPPVRIARGGVLDPGDVERLRALIGEGPVEFLPVAVVGTPDRAAVARLLVQGALQLVGDRADKGGNVEIQLLAPLAHVLELGHPVEGLLPGGPERLWVPRSARVLALECLGLARVVGEQARPAAAAAPPGADELLAHLGVALVDEAPGDWLPGIAAHEAPDPELAVGLATADELLCRGQWEMAERLLVGLRDRRLDHPGVLLLLASAKVGDATRLTVERVEDARRWITLARMLGPSGPEQSRLLEAACRNVALAEQVLLGRVASPGDASCRSAQEA